jgi:Fe-S-cluster containining protein
MAEFLARLRRLYARMDADYAAAAAGSGFVCNGCEESCCRTRFYHHTRIEAVCLRAAFGRLPAEERKRIRRLAEEWRAGGAARVRPLCPLNREGRCRLYDARPMICRLHGIPHALAPPGRPAQESPGCEEFDRRCRGIPHRRLDRTPLYTELARLENEFQQALRASGRFKQTIADMLLAERPIA